MNGPVDRLAIVEATADYRRLLNEALDMIDVMAPLARYGDRDGQRGRMIPQGADGRWDGGQEWTRQDDRIAALFKAAGR